MGKGPPTLQEHLSHITEAQFVTQPPEDDEENDIRGVFEIVEGRVVLQKFLSSSN